MLSEGKRPVLRKHCRGANLALFCGVSVLLLGFMGICIYTGLQAFLEGDLQRVTMNSALAGASRYYSQVGSYGKPTPSPDTATAYARQIFGLIAANSSLNGFGATVKEVSYSDVADSVTVKSSAVLNTSLLSLVGIKDIKFNATATARAIKYEPTLFTGPIEILPDGKNLDSYSKTLILAFPLLDGEGTDLYIEQPAETQQGYVVEACNATLCYNIVEAATPVGTSQILTASNGERLIYGSATFDLKKVGVNKATQLRFTHGNDFEDGYYDHGAAKSYYAEQPAADPAAPAPDPAVPAPDPATSAPAPQTATPLPLTIQRVMIFGHASTCSAPAKCSIPAGFVPVE